MSTTGDISFDPGASVELRLGPLVGGGRSKSQLPDGRVVFVAGGAPGDEVVARITHSAKRFAEAEVVDLRVAGPDRVAPPCSGVAAGCGGCDWQHLSGSAQREAKRSLVIDALSRIGAAGAAPGSGGEGEFESVVNPTVELPLEAYRTTVRAVVTDGRPAFRARSSQNGVIVDECLVAHPLVAEILSEARLGDSLEGRELTIRASVSTGARLVVVDGPTDEVRLPSDTVVVSQAELDAGKRAWIFEEVAGRAWRVSARSFFQPGPLGAETIVGLVRTEVERAREWLGHPLSKVLDAYGGIGLLGGSVGAETLTVVEQSRDAAADARVNLAEGPKAKTKAKVRLGAMAAWNPIPHDLVIVDPPRAGLSTKAMRRLVAADPQAMVMVSCDPATFARDVLNLAERFALVSTTPVDQFGHTSHVETVSLFFARTDGQ